MIMTGNAPDPVYRDLMDEYQKVFNGFVGPTEIFISGDTRQLKDYSKTD